MLVRESCHDFNISGDPVRPEISMDFRLDAGREVYKFVYKDEVAAVVCVAYTEHVPVTMDELDALSCNKAFIAIPYTVWSLKHGFGRSILFALLKHLKQERPEVQRVVTLSPKTEMAYRFHIANGAKQISSNPESDNYEYSLERET